MANDLPPTPHFRLGQALTDRFRLFWSMAYCLRNVPAVYVKSLLLALVNEFLRDFMNIIGVVEYFVMDRLGMIE